MRRTILGAALFLAVASPLAAADILAPASQRFVVADAKEVPSFQRHVVPLMGRLGCNGRACHGSFQGQGGFRLSLFGYDFVSDLEALLGGEQPRVNRKEPVASLMLQKPTRTVPHEGGQRMKVDSWQYNLFLRWIQGGAVGTREGDLTFETLHVEPKEMVLGKIGQTLQLRVVAQWSDGSREDVTPLCRFRSNDEAIASVDASGLVTATGKGDTDVVAFYDNGVVPVQVMLPVSDLAGSRYPRVPTPTKIDEAVVGKLRKLGIVPADLCTDAEFLRRLRLDLTGTLPTPSEITAFLADNSPDKRTRKIDELLNTPAYAAWWATKLCDYTGNNEQNGPLGGEQGLRREQAEQWYRWIYRRVNENVPYDKLVEGIVLATSRRPGQSYDDYCAEMSSYFRKDNPADFSARENMPYYWIRRKLNQPGEKALSFGYSFLGVSLQCAQCHKHPYDQWTKQDFDQFTAFFAGVRYGESNGNRGRVQELKKAVGLTGDQDSGAYKRSFAELLHQGKTLPFKEVTVPARANKGRTPAKGKSLAGRVITPKLLGGEQVIASEYNDPRQPLMDWMREADNPYFARAFVNRVWASYFHVGIIDPPDDMNLANPPSNTELLDSLSQGFVAHKYDMKWLHREITTSLTYQRSWRPNDTNRHDERNFSRAVLRRLPAEVAYDAIAHATASDEAMLAMHREPVSTRAIGVASCYGNPRDASIYAVNLFGKPPRALNCDCERSSEPSLLQTVYLRNDQEVLKMLDRSDGWLRQLARSKDRTTDDLICEAYLRTVSRLPEENERQIARKYLAEAKESGAGMRDLLWALINTKEFIVNR